MTSGDAFTRAHEETGEALGAYALGALPDDEAREVRSALGTLPPDQLKVIELAYFGGFTHVEIAEMLEAPIGTVKGRMRLGLKKMREVLAQGAVG